MLVLPRVARDDVALIGAVARWLDARALPRGTALGRRTEALAGGPVRALGIAEPLGDPHAARCELRVGGASLEILGASAGVRRIAQHVLGGPPELAAPRPLGAVEHAVWALAVAAALEDLGVAGEVWPCEGPVAAGDARELAIAIDVAGAPLTLAVRVPRSLAARTPPRPAPGVGTCAPGGSPAPPWADRVRVPAPLVLGRCRLDRAQRERLAVRAVVTLDRASELVVLGGAVGVALRGPAGEVVVEVATGYVPRAMSLPDDARVELTVGFGATQLSLRQVLELAVGQVVPLGAPVAGPFEIRASGALLGRGELVDVDGELGVRIVSLGEP